MAEEGDELNDERLARGRARARSFRAKSPVIGTVYDIALNQNLPRLPNSHELSVLLELRDWIGHFASRDSDIVC